MHARIGFTLAITITLAVGALHALAALTLATRPRIEAWAARCAHGTGLYPRRAR